jgi:hypothetical protein
MVYLYNKDVDTAWRKERGQGKSTEFVWLRDELNAVS